jgi:hypothetical protein
LSAAESAPDDDRRDIQATPPTEIIGSRSDQPAAHLKQATGEREFRSAGRTGDLGTVMTSPKMPAARSAVRGRPLDRFEPNNDGQFPL